MEEMKYSIEVKAPVTSLAAFKAGLAKYALVYENGVASNQSDFMLVVDGHGHESAFDCCKIRRETLPDGGTTSRVIAYTRDVADAPFGVQKSSYYSVPLDSASPIISIFLGITKSQGVVSKTRITWAIGATRIHHDSVSHLPGHYAKVEVAIQPSTTMEGAAHLARQVAKDLGLGEITHKSYRRLVFEANYGKSTCD